MDEAPRLVQGYVEHYNNIRLNSAISYITPRGYAGRTPAGDSRRTRPEVGSGSAATANFVASRSHKKGRSSRWKTPPLRPIDPGLHCSLIVVRISARQQYAAIAELRFSHVVPLVVQLARHH